MTPYDKHARILVIDDDDIVRTALLEMLEAVGHTVFELPSAIGATRVITQNAIDTVVIDVMLPDIDGDKLAKLLRHTARSADVTIILVSARSTEELQALALAAGADAVVTKADIRLKLASTVESARRRRALVRCPASSRGGT
jgi:DNA-binding response OmpR family regulator